MHRRWDVSLLGVGMERFRRLYRSWGYERRDTHPFVRTIIVAAHNCKPHQLCHLGHSYHIITSRAGIEMRWGGNGMKN